MLHLARSYFIFHYIITSTVDTQHNYKNSPTTFIHKKFDLSHIMLTHYYSFNAVVSLESLLPPPGGGTDEQFKETLMVLCTIDAAVYCSLYNEHCYFDVDDLNGKSCESSIVHTYTLATV